MPKVCDPPVPSLGIWPSIFRRVRRVRACKRRLHHGTLGAGHGDGRDAANKAGQTQSMELPPVGHACAAAAAVAGAEQLLCFCNQGLHSLGINVFWTLKPTRGERTSRHCSWRRCRRRPPAPAGNRHIARVRSATSRAHCVKLDASGEVDGCAIRRPHTEFPCATPIDGMRTAAAPPATMATANRTMRARDMVIAEGLRSVGRTFFIGFFGLSGKNIVKIPL